MPCCAVLTGDLSAAALQLQSGTAADEVVGRFGVEDADPIIGNFISRRASWRGVSDLRPLAGQEVSIRLVATDASIFSVTLACAN